MRETIKKCYFGLWQNMYQISWPIRFFIELALLIFVGFCLVKVICWAGKKLKLKNLLVKVMVWIVTEIVYIVGHGSEWAVVADNKMIDWGTAVINGEKRKKSNIVKWGICLGVIAVYFMAVFVDLSAARHLSGYYLEELEGTKAFFQKFEIMLSKGCEKYPPLFVKIEEGEPEEEIVEETAAMVEEREPVYIRLNERGKRGSNIRSETNLDNSNNIIGGVNAESEILYCGEWTHDGDRYWVRVYVSADDVEGWLSGNLVEGEQLEEIIGER